MRRLLSLSHASAAVHPREGNQEPKSLVVDVITYHASNQGLGHGQCRLWFATDLIMIVLHCALFKLHWTSKGSLQSTRADLRLRR
jgi:hypothetical protein